MELWVEKTEDVVGVVVSLVGAKCHSNSDEMNYLFPDFHMPRDL